MRPKRCKRDTASWPGPQAGGLVISLVLREMQGPARGVDSRVILRTAVHSRDDAVAATTSCATRSERPHNRKEDHQTPSTRRARRSTDAAIVHGVDVEHRVFPNTFIGHDLEVFQLRHRLRSVELLVELTRIPALFFREEELSYPRFAC